jgi:glycosyltransferase involved in cell wall biosynthesis
MTARGKPNIVFLTRSLDTGGAERQIVELATGLRSIGWDVKVATYYGGGSLEHCLREAGIDPICLGKRGRWDIARFLWRLWKLLRELRPDIAHGYLELANIPLTLLRPLLRSTRVVWGVRRSGMDALEHDWFARAEIRVSTWLSRFADLIICNSRAGHAYHAQQGYPGERMVVIPNGIDLKQFRPDSEARAELRGALGIADGQRLVGLIARLHPMKDHQNFLRAAAQVADSDSDVRFICVGDGPDRYREELVSLGANLGLGKRIIWSPARADAWRVYNALDVAVSASSCGEGFSNAVAEAMATGVPVVATDVGDSAAVVGAMGWVCAPHDSAALGAAISAALAALPVDAAAVRQRIAVNFGAAELLRRTVEHLSRLIEPRPGTAQAHAELGR